MQQQPGTMGQMGMMQQPQQPMMAQQQGGALVQEYLSSHPVLLFQPELCGGLAVTLSYRNGAKPSIYANATCVVITVKATSENIRRIKLTMPSEIKRTPALEEIPALAPGQEYTYSIEMVLQGFEGKKQSIILTCDRGTYNSTYAPELADLLTPLPMSTEEFMAARSKLTSFHEVTRTLEGASLGSAEVVDRVQRIINTRLIASTPAGEIQFASCFRKGMAEERVLVTVSTQAGLSIRLNCDNAAFANSLLDIFGKKMK